MTLVVILVSDRQRSYHQTESEGLDHAVALLLVVLISTWVCSSLALLPVAKL